MSVLVLADHDLGALLPATARIVQGATRLGRVDILVVAENPAPIADAAAQLVGVSRVFSVQGSLVADSVATLLARLSEGYTTIIASAGSVGRDVMPRLAALLDVMPVTDVTAILGPARFERSIYAGNAIETISDPQLRHVLTLRASAFRATASGNAAPIESIENPVISAAHIITQLRSESDRPDLSTARIVIGGGGALGSAEQFKLIENLARTLGAGIGATRAAVDAGYAPNDWQIGQTGKSIAPDLYIAIGISGALQHLAGIQGAKKIVAINNDPRSPLVKLADIAMIGDLFEIVPQLTAELEKRVVKR